MEYVYIVEDDDAVRDSLELLMTSDGKSVKTYASADAFLEDYDDSMRGCLILDIRMPGMDGLELQQVLKRKRSALPIIFVTGHGDVPMAVQAMREGAVDFIQKPYQNADMTEKVTQALEIGHNQQHTEHERKAIAERLDSLTPREREILDMMVAGKANKVMAIDLGISQRTVEIHRSRVMHKMGQQSLARLIQMVMLVQDNA